MPPVEGAAPLLEVDRLEVRYGQIVAVRDLSFKVRPGELLALLGPNGAGKSSTLRAITGLLRPSAGQVRFKGDRIDRLPAERIARLGIAHVPEGRGIFPDLTVRENLRMPTGRLTEQQFETALENVHRYFPRLRERASQLGGTLSGGEQQQLAIGRALMVRPTLLLLDEMSLGLAPTVVEQLFEILRRINQDGVAVLLVEQYVGAALALADTAVVLEKGSVRLAGSAAQLANDVSVVQASYLGGAAVQSGREAPDGPAFREPLGVHLTAQEMRRIAELARQNGTSPEELGRQALQSLLAGTGAD
jgi:branched-chain amino acid transport system ATP-binding protein